MELPVTLSEQWIERADQIIMKTYGRYAAKAAGCGTPTAKNISTSSPGWR